MKHSIDCVGFKPLREGTLVGFADVTIAELKLTIRDVTLHQKGSARWAIPPGRPWLKDGVAVTDADGKIRYSQIIEFADRGTQNAFSAAVWKAVLDFAPEAVSS